MHMNPDTWSKARQIGECLVEFGGRVCMIQLSADRHFIVENPAVSEIFHLLCFVAVFNAGKVVQVNVPQCALGLVLDGQTENTHTYIYIYIYIYVCIYIYICVYIHTHNMNGEQHVARTIVRRHQLHVCITWDFGRTVCWR